MSVDPRIVISKMDGVLRATLTADVQRLAAMGLTKAQIVAVFELRRWSHDAVAKGVGAIVGREKLYDVGEFVLETMLRACRSSRQMMEDVGGDDASRKLLEALDDHLAKESPK